MISWSLEEGSASLKLTCESDADGGYLASIEASVDGFTGHADGHVAGRDLAAFVDALTRLEKSRKGEAKLESAASGEFELRLHSIDSRGHMGVSGSLRFSRLGGDYWPHQQLRFSFEFDSSKLAALLRSLGVAAP
jgi:hypothetical protein